MRILVYLTILLLLLANAGCSDFTSNEPIKSDFEDFSKKGFSTNHKSILVENGLQSNEESRSGNYSLKIAEGKEFGMRVVIKNIIPDTRYRIKVWRKQTAGRTILTTEFKGLNYVFRSSDKVVMQDSLGWELLVLNVFIPPNPERGDLHIYIWNIEKTVHYFDDLSIEEINGYPEFEGESLHILMNESELDKLKLKRKQAFDKGVLITQSDDYVDAYMVDNADTLKVEMRLKGDWLDHLAGQKWSFRIKVKKNKAWRRMTTFSLQTPEARGWLNEWIAHKILWQEDILTTRYGFIPVYLNGRSLGMYAYEEHFDKHLVENYQRREGPIIKYSEDNLWLFRSIKDTAITNHHLPFYQASVIRPFKQSKVMKSHAMQEDFIKSRDLLYSVQTNQWDGNGVFDVVSYAKYMAMNDFLRANHSQIWHNRRYYYNPVTNLLEPVMYDLYTDYSDHTPQAMLSEIYLGGCLSNENSYLQLFNQEEFREHYLKYLDQYSNSAFWQKFMEENSSEIKRIEYLLEKEFPYYRFDYEFLLNASQYVQSRYKGLQNQLSEESMKQMVCSDHLNFDKFLSQYHPTLISQFTHAYLIYESDTGHMVLVKNFNSYPIAIMGYGSAKSQGIAEEELLAKEIVLNPGEQTELELRANSRADFLLVSAIENAELNAVAIIGWQAPDANSTNPDEEQEKHIHFAKGVHTINKSVVIGRKGSLTADAGAIIDLNKGAYILSYSPVKFLGTRNQKIQIISTDGTGKGLTVLGAKGISKLSNVMIDQQNNFENGNWTLTGAVNFYQTDVSLINCSFINNRCEDALNIIRSEFLIENCTFDNIFADAFDSDFSTGSITESTFRDVGNDALDFSGSEVSIESVEILDVGDKGISGGEASKVKISNSSIDGANLAVASKDLSEVSINQLAISNANYGLVAFCKKGEYGAATLRAKNVSITTTNKAFLFEKGSTIELNEHSEYSFKKNVAELFYPGK